MEAPLTSVVPVANLRTSERRDFKRCPQRWSWGWRYGLKPKGEPSIPLWFGIGMHEVLAHWYCGPGKKRGAKPLQVWDEYIGESLRYVRTIPWEGAEYSEQKYVEAGELGREMLVHYFDVYGRDSHCSMIAPEQTFQVYIELLDEKGHKTGKFIEYDGTFDGVYRDSDTGKLWLWEHKTAAAIRTSHLPMDDQAGSYWAVASSTLQAQGLIKKGEKLEGIMYNFLRKALPDDRPENQYGQKTNKPQKADYIAALNAHGGDEHFSVNPKCTLTQLEEMAVVAGIKVLGEVSKNQPPPHFLREPVRRTPSERNTQITRIGSEASVMEQFRNKLLPLFKNPTNDCSWDCSFFELCKLQETYPRDVNEYVEAAFYSKDPYEDHRKSASGGD